MTGTAAPAGAAYFQLSDWISGTWPLPRFVTDALDHVFFSTFPDPNAADTSNVMSGALVITDDVTVDLPGIDVIRLKLGATDTGTELAFSVDVAAPSITVEALPVSIVVDPEVLRPVQRDSDGNWQPTGQNASLPVNCSLTLALDAAGEFRLSMSGPAGFSLSTCEVGGTGVVVDLNGLAWVDDAQGTGLSLAAADVYLPRIPNRLSMTGVMIGTGGITGTVAVDPPTISDVAQQWWDGTAFVSDLAFSFAGFEAALWSASVSFHRNALVAASLQAEMWLPYIDRRLGLTLALDGNGGLGATARTPFVAAGTADAAQPSDGHLFNVAIGPAGNPSDPQAPPIVALDVDSVSFLDQAGTAAVELAGLVTITLDALGSPPPFAVRGLRIDSRGHVAIEGGWIDLGSDVAMSFAGFGFEVTRLGFGQDGDSTRWLGLNGGIHLAPGVPLGASVKGLRVPWTANPDGSWTIGAPELAGIGVDVTVPGVMSLQGQVSSFDEGTAHGFRGDITLTLTALSVDIDADLVIGHDGTEPFFYIHLGVDLPAGIPLFQSGAALFGFEGLVAKSMAPNRQAGEEWYEGWYLRNTKGATASDKWSVQDGAFALGAGTTVGTLVDTGFTASAKVLLVVVLPGPTLLLQGRGQFLSKAPAATDPSSSGTFDALIVLDVADQVFEAGVSVTYDVEKLVHLSGGADLLFQAGSHPDWHLWLGKDTPAAARWQARVVSLFDAQAYLMIGPSGLKLGATITIVDGWNFGPVQAALIAVIDGAGDVAWRPTHMHGQLSLTGEATLEAFGVGVTLQANATVTASGPTPWVVHTSVSVSIHVGFLVGSFDWKGELTLDWSDTAAPSPVSLTEGTKVAFEHLSTDLAPGIVDATLPAAGAITVPPDAKPVVVFPRPMQDHVGLSTGGDPNLLGDDVGTKWFSYQLHHFVLTDGSGTAVAAAGGLQVDGGVISLAGAPDLSGLDGVIITVTHVDTHATTTTTIHTGGAGVTLGTTVADGPYVYTASRQAATEPVTISSVTALSFNTARIDLSADPAGPATAGMLSQGGGRWVVLAQQDNHIWVQDAPGSPSALPVAGTAELTGAPSPTLGGVWLSTTGPQPPGTTTRFMLWGRTPFAWLRHTTGLLGGTDAPTAPGLCGPDPTEEPVCQDFDQLPLGPLDSQFTAGLLSGSCLDATVIETPGSRAITTGGGTPGGGSAGSGSAGATWVSFRFGPPVETVFITCGAWATNDGVPRPVTVTAYLAGQALVTETVTVTRDRVQLAAAQIDEVRVTGTGAVIWSVCFLPGWTCTGFDASSFPQHQRGMQSYAGLEFDAWGDMYVAAGELRVDWEPPAVHVSGPGQIAGQIEQAAEKMVQAGEEIGRRVTSAWRRIRGETAGRPRPPVPAPVAHPVGGPVLAPGSGTGWQRPRLLDVSVTVMFPQPVTRVRAHLASAADLSAYGGTAATAHGSGAAGQDVVLTTDEWIDRVVISGTGHVALTEICYDAGAFGWQRYQQWAWGSITASAYESLYRADQVLPPGDYQLHVSAGVATAADRSGGGDPDFSHAPAPQAFAVGPPIGLATDGQYAAAGRLQDLSCYVAATVPEDGRRPWYRSLDVGVAFTIDSMSRMYLEAGRPLVLWVTEAGGATAWSDIANRWGDGPLPSLSQIDQAFIDTLESDGTGQCATVTPGQLSTPQTLSAGSAEALRPRKLHTVSLRAIEPSSALSTAGSVGEESTADAAGLLSGSTEVFAFHLTTSAYARPAQHLADDTGTASTLSGTAGTVPSVAALATLSAAVDSAAANATAVEVRLKGRPAGAASPTFADVSAALAKLTDARNALNTGWGRAWADLASALGVDGPRPRPSRLAWTAFSDALLVESPEPMPWPYIQDHRGTSLDLSVGHSSLLPLRRRHAVLTDPAVLPPDRDMPFALDGISMTSDQQLTAGTAGTTSLAGGSWQLVIDTSDALRAQITVSVDQRGQARVTSGRAAPRTVGPGRHTERINLQGAATLVIEGDGFSVSELLMDVTARPVLPTGALRLGSVAVYGPDQWVEVLAYDDVDLAGYSIRWADTVAPAAATTVCTVPPATGAATTLGDGQRAQCLFNAGATGDGSAYQLAFSGSATGMAAGRGGLIQLVDPGGEVVDELVLMPASKLAAVSVTAVPSDDACRAFLVPAAGTPVRGFWQIGGVVAGDAATDLTPMTIAGVPSYDGFVWSFIAG